MDIQLFKNQIRFAIPEELYNIEPGQVVFFIPREGMNFRTASVLMDFYRDLGAYHPDANLDISIVTTENELLIGGIAARTPQETGIPYNVIVSSWDTVAGFASQFFGEDMETIMERLPRYGGVRSARLLRKDAPAVVVSIDPANRPAKVQSQSVEQRIESSYQAGFDLGMKIAKPEAGSLAEKKLIAKEEKKLEKILRECAILDIELDVDRIKQKVIYSLKSTIEYKLALNIKTIKEDSLSFCTVCDIYVAEGEEYKLDLTAGEKAVYLTFMLYKDGIRIKETAESSFRSITQKIYNQLPDDNKCEKTAGGILDTGDVIYDVYEKTLRGNISTIRAEIADKIANPLIAQDFAIEGFKDKEFGISKSTPELIAQIKQAFGL